MILERDRWPRGLVRHLRLDESCPLDKGRAVREERDGGLDAGGSEDVVYTLVVHPKHVGHAEELRRMLEANPAIGGPFSPSRDLKTR